MIVRLILGAFLAAVVVFFWGSVWWGMLAVSAGTYSTLPVDDQDAVTEALKAKFTTNDVYFIPMIEPSQHGNQEADEAFMSRHKAGPIMQIFYKAEGVEFGSPMIMLKGFVHMFASALIIGAILMSVLSGTCCYSGRVALVWCIALFSGFWQEGSDVVWFHHPMGFSLFGFGYDVTAWLLGGLVLAAIVKKTKVDQDSEKPATAEEN